jgi:Ca-activated chloride channel family protein
VFPNVFPMIGDFHFLRPWWLIALLPAALLLWRVGCTQSADWVWHGIIAEHLLPHLFLKREQQQRIGPLVLLAAVWALAIVALAGPAWNREPAPFADDSAALVIVVKVTPSMKTEDVQPDRLTRTVQKIHDLLALRSGARSALIAYAGTSHLVVPLTRDAGIVNTFAAALDPKIMPDDGDAAVEALALADQVLARSGQSGSIVWITDGIAPDQQNVLSELRKHSHIPVRVLAPLLRGPELDLLEKMAAAVGAPVLPITPDDADVRDLARAAKYVSATVSGQGDHWQDTGYWLIPLIALLSALWFRPGWMVSTSATS